MPAYVSLFNFTEQGIRNVKDTAKRAQAVRAAFEKAGGSFIGIWWLLGQYDCMVISEFPDDVTATHMLLQVGMQGNVRTTTLRAFGEEDIGKIIEGL